MANKTQTAPTVRHTTDTALAAGGSADRGPATARENQTPTQPENPALAVTGEDGGPAGNVSHLVTGKGKRTNIFNVAAAEVSQQVALKVQVMQSARQHLAEASDLFREGDGKAKEATEVADKAAVALYQARTSGAVSAEEVSAALGDVFGYKPKKDGTPGKTPDGQGEAIRKRVVRAVQASTYLNDGDGGRFFDDLPVDEIADIVNALENDTMSIWTAYERFAEVKREHAVKTNMAFDAKRIAGLVEALSEEGAAKSLTENPALVAAYGALMNVLTVVGEEAQTMREAKEKKAA